MRILAIETSCDDTAAAVVEGGRVIRSNVVASQTAVHQKFGGVVPEIASRKHLEWLTPVVEVAMEQAALNFGDLDAIAVTYGPGLVGPLLVGVSSAKAMAYALNLPLAAVNHLEGHIYANFLEHADIEFPALVLIVSGGHTDLVLMSGHGEYRLVGQTRDDAAGEAFDKVARFLELGYPGGPVIEQAGTSGDPEAIALPRAWLGADSLEFSFSGLKTAVISFVQKERAAGRAVSMADLAASFQWAVVEVLVEKTLAAARQFEISTILAAGGVAANQCLRFQLTRRSEAQGIRLRFPAPALCTDNAAMIGCAGFYRLQRGAGAAMTLNAKPNLSFNDEINDM